METFHTISVMKAESALRRYSQSASLSDLCSVSKFPWRGRKLPERDWTCVFVYWAEGLWYDWNHRCSLSLLCCAAGAAQRTDDTTPLTSSSDLPLPLTMLTNPGKELLAMPAGVTCQHIWVISEDHVWEWELKVGFVKDIRINSDEPSLFRSVRRVFLSSSFSVSSGVFSPSFCRPLWRWWDCNTGGSVGGEAFEEQSSHGLQLGPTRDFWPWPLRNPPSSCLPRDKETAVFL